MNETSPPVPPVRAPDAAAALQAIHRAVEDAHRASGGAEADTADTAGAAAGAAAGGGGPEQALEALRRLREVRERITGWESVLIETARGQGVSWAELAGPLGVASRQAAERRYLRLRPGAAGSTGEQRVQATRDARAADRSVTAWARDNAADLRRLAGQVTSLTGLPPGAEGAVGELNLALGGDDAARLVGPLAGTRPHLGPGDAELADRIDAMTRHADRLRRDSNDQRNS
ncbi:HSP18 transcriptional regulator [Streptomyces sp. TN58]|uniref:HSP18 transcriptional regulator n=1 Tax=Streptomyces sp. TN58 TaxID=234612 RepID=UPI00095098B8|nr:HSP18 transcriptional regulator [Streptomyces sp. TN58]APU44926.1 HSP18 transcriptional regulator [Streptomyces sp. TN58]